MEKTKIKIGILPNYFLKSDKSFDLDGAIKLSGKIAGECYDKEGFEHLEHEPEEVTMSRVDRVLDRTHFSVFDHVMINFNFQNIPKILAMTLNNENEYTTSEKSGRYTPIVRKEGSIITLEEQNLYDKWLEILKIKIKSQYGYFYNDNKIKLLAQENARYLVSVFVPTQMIHTTSLAQINNIAIWMQDYINKHAITTSDFEKKLCASMKEFIAELERINVIFPRLQINNKRRKLSIFGEELDKKEEHFGDVYSTTYYGSFAQYAQAQRHRTLDYQMEILDDKEYFIPPIIADDPMLVDEWLKDMQIVKNVNPQGEIVKIHESGSYGNFILKCKERLCSAAQLEIMMQTRETLLKYKSALENSHHPLASDIEKYSHGARCTFPDFYCTHDCKFKEGKTLVRKI